MNFGDFDLSKAEVGGELNPLAYNPDEYPTIEEVLGGVLMGPEEPVYISAEELSVNGLVVADKMSEYLANESESSSAMKEVLKNAASYFFYTNDKSNFTVKVKPHFELGSYCHMAFLEPMLFDLVVAEPEVNLSTTKGVKKLIEFWEKEIVKKEGKTIGSRKVQAVYEILSNENDLTKMEGQKLYLKSLKEMSGLLSVTDTHYQVIKLQKRHYYSYGGGIIPLLLKGAQFEHSFYGVDSDTGLKVKVRPDAFNVAENVGVNMVISLKTTSATDMGKFIYDTAKYKYELAEGNYQNVMSDVTGRQFNVTIMIAVQTVAPFLPAVFMWGPEDLSNGKYKARYALDTIKECKDTKLFPGFEGLAEQGHYGIIQLNQPEWAKKLIQPVDLEN